jgi:redox-sensitive bicupin YhaK (pirin superfamily)
MLQGEGFHRDNAGNDETIKAGDVQWMFAGKGILHSEGPTKEMLQTGGVQELVQLWINAPQANKWDKPFYQAATKTQQPLVLQQEGVNLRLASGEYDGQTGPIQNFTPIISIVGEIGKGRVVNFPATPGYWALLYIIKGNVTINGGQEVAMHNLVVFSKEGDVFTVKAEEDAQVLFLSAEPLDEPVAAKDNFVMNTAAEIEQAIDDYKNGVFGKLSW